MSELERPWEDCEECQQLLSTNIDYTCSKHARAWADFVSAPYVPPEGSIVVEATIGCARCGGDHARILFRKFTRPVDLDTPHEASDLTHFGTCPTLHEPILMRFREIEKAGDTI